VEEEVTPAIIRTLFPEIKFKINLFPIEKVLPLGPLNSTINFGVHKIIDADLLKEQVEISVSEASKKFKDGDEFTLTGIKALRVKDRMTNGVKNDYSSYPLMIID
jgi:hypothetical protein